MKFPRTHSLPLAARAALALAVLVLALLLLAGCRAEEGEPIADANGGGLPYDPANANWTYIDSNILSGQCATGGCHDGTQSPDMTAGCDSVVTAVVTAGDKESSSLYTKVDSGSMRTYLTAGEEDREAGLIGRWIDDGAACP